MAIIQNKTLILLIDFHGHPILGDDHTNNLRYSELMYFLNEQQFQYNIVSVSYTHLTLPTTLPV